MVLWGEADGLIFLEDVCRCGFGAGSEAGATVLWGEADGLIFLEDVCRCGSAA
jgi:hypothetical protein